MFKEVVNLVVTRVLMLWFKAIVQYSCKYEHVHAFMYKKTNITIFVNLRLSLVSN